ncbi:MAG: [FeFe] hydrogenase H-cluster radical SAM maturase HydE [bacterium]|nr:[FeFe] hydrogenase H-cluster radical SAM maturase HydE [bacterium]
MNPAEIIEELLYGELPTLSQITTLLSPGLFEENALFAVADETRRRYTGDGIHLRAIIELSNYCERNCVYCGLRRDNDTIRRYRMASGEIVERAAQVYGMGYRTVVLQSGEDSYYTPEIVADIISQIKHGRELTVTLSLGERPRDVYQLWHDAGADRYLLKHETSDDALYSQLHPDLVYEDRFGCLRDLKEIGYEVGSGIMMGLPGQAIGSYAADILFFAETEIDMIGIGPFIYNPATPITKPGPFDIDMVYRLIAVARLVTKNTHIPATTALALRDVDDGRRKALSVGANVIMPNLTPEKYRADYAIYPDKATAAEVIADSRESLGELAESLGRHIDGGVGGSRKKTGAN